MDFLLLALTALGQESDFRAGLGTKGHAPPPHVSSGVGDIDQGQMGFAHGMIGMGCEAGLVRPAGCPKSFEI